MTWWKADSRLMAGARMRSILRDHGSERAKCAAIAWAALLGVNAEHGCDGTIAPLYAAADYVLAFAPMLDLDELEMALADLELADLIDRHDGARGIVITGWDETWRAMSASTARVRLYRDRKKREREGRTKPAPGVLGFPKPKQEEA